MKFGIRSAVDVVFKTTRSYTGIGEDFLLTRGRSWEKGEPVLYFDTLKTATTEGTSETVYAQGGAGNPRLIAWEGDKTVTFTFEDALISIEGMSILTGAGLIDASTSNKVRVHKKAIVQAGTAGAIDISGELLKGSNYDETLYSEDIFGFLVTPNGEISERLGKATAMTDPTAITFDGVTEGQTVLVDFYVERDSGATEISIEPDKFAGYFYIEGSTLFRRQSDGKDLESQMIIPNAKIQTAFEFSMSPEGDPSTFTFTADAFPGVIAGDTSLTRKLYALRILED